MIATSFDESNFYFDKPDDMTYDECSALSVFVGKDISNNGIVLSCWKPTEEELKEINKTGRVWCFHFGSGLQPHALSGHNPFTELQ
jgi:hypothetical protein